MSRRKAVQTLAQAQTIVDSYNDNFNESGVDVQLQLDIRDDVQEELIMRRYRGNASDFEGDEEDGSEDEDDREE